MFQIHFVNCEQFGSECVESGLFELSDVVSISFVKTEDYNRCCMHHVRLHRRRCPTCCLCRGYPNICRTLPTLPLATSASASGNKSDLQLSSALAPSNLQNQLILGRLQADFEKSYGIGAYLTLCDPTLTTPIPSRPCAHLEHICACTRTCSRHPSCGYPALSETATSGISRSRQ
ncbi:hypothetical protein M405DRAFT_937365 [Rhizopogon salebrosus TDB-379]|nr:hypothetical protein M405DRAFT_937365 [Rhizopogon salebrosus TDB-379]